MKRLFASFLALIVLTINAGPTYAAHYCQGKLVKSSISILSHDLSCGMTDMVNPCDEPETDAITKQSCCENEYHQLKIDDEFQAPVVPGNSVSMAFIHALVVSHFNLYAPFSAGIIASTFYSPPLPDHDIQVMVQSFLI